MFNSRAIEDDAPVRRAVRELINRLQRDRDAVITLRRNANGLSLVSSNGESLPVFVGPELAERVLIRLRLMADIDMRHPGLVHGIYELQQESGEAILSIRSNRTSTLDEVSVTFDKFGSERMLS
ncbi:hypothetical protein [Allorhodopirellula heiligendammensis]|nr:hypothetical protein [Allorhodopirellula heiligendammensis]